MKDKSKAIAADENDVAVTKDFEKFLTDFSANKIDKPPKSLKWSFPSWRRMWQIQEYSQDASTSAQAKLLENLSVWGSVRGKFEKT